MSYLDELFSVAGKTALVTGAATGIGRMAATALVKAGANVMIASRKGADCERRRRRAQRARRARQGGRFRRRRLHRSRHRGARRRGQGSARDRLDILINNAGTSWGAPFEDFPYHAWAKVMGVNVTGGLPPDPRTACRAGEAPPATTTRPASSISAR